MVRHQAHTFQEARDCLEQTEGHHPGTGRGLEEKYHDIWSARQRMKTEVWGQAARV